jgi:serine/threonine-protein kinase
VPALIESGSGSEPIGGTSPIPLECRSVWAPVHQETYDGSGYTAIARRSVKGDAPDAPGAVEAVATFPDAQAAKAALDRVVAVWNKCKFFEFTEQYRGRDVNWKTGVVGDNDGVFTMPVFSRSQLDSPDTSTDPNCQRAATAVRNVVVDLLACTPELGSEGLTFARDIAAKVNAAP